MRPINGCLDTVALLGFLGIYLTGIVLILCGGWGIAAGILLTLCATWAVYSIFKAPEESGK